MNKQSVNQGKDSRTGKSEQKPVKSGSQTGGKSGYQSPGKSNSSGDMSTSGKSQSKNTSGKGKSRMEEDDSE